MFSHSRYYRNKKVFPLPAENCQPLRGFPLGGSSLRSEVMRGSRFSTKQSDEEKPAFLFCLKNCLNKIFQTKGRTLFSHSRYYSNKKVFPLPAENCQPLCGFPSGGSSLRSEVMRGSRFSTKQGDEEKPAFLFCLKNCLNKIFRTKGRSLFSHSRYYSNKINQYYGN